MGNSNKQDPINDKLRKEIGKRFRIIRKRLGIIQDNFGAAIGVVGNTVSKYENEGFGINFRNVEDAAKLFDIHPGQLYGHQTLEDPIPQFKECLHALLELNEMTIEELYYDLRTKFTYLSEPHDIVRKISIELLFAIANRFGVPVDRLVGRSIPENIQSIRDKFANGSILDENNSPLSKEDTDFFLRMFKQYILSKRNM